eukprot:scaffold15367_cov71-Phaeocystis_antarctica.AAC.2
MKTRQPLVSPRAPWPSPATQHPSRSRSQHPGPRTRLRTAATEVPDGVPGGEPLRREFASSRPLRVQAGESRGYEWSVASLSTRGAAQAVRSCPCALPRHPGGGKIYYETYCEAPRLPMAADPRAAP